MPIKNQERQNLLNHQKNRESSRSSGYASEQLNYGSTLGLGKKFDESLKYGIDNDEE